MFKSGKWSSPPPEYEPIMNGLSLGNAAPDKKKNVGEYIKGNKSNLDMYIEMTGDQRNKYGDADTSEEYSHQFEEQRGKVYSLDQIRDRFAGYKGRTK